MLDLPLMSHTPTRKDASSQRLCINLRVRLDKTLVSFKRGSKDNFDKTEVGQVYEFNSAFVSCFI